AVGVSLAVAACVLAARSPAYPIALWAVPSLAAGVFGSSLFANATIELFLTGFGVLAVLFAVLRDPRALPLRLLLSPPVLLSLGLAILLAVRLGASPAPESGRFELHRFLAESLLFLVAGIAIARRRADLE